MKVIIKKLHLKNFFSFGNKWSTIPFEQGLYRVQGENLDNNTRNGAGKSVGYCDGLMFGLFGKPLRKINLPDIPNTINGKKGCEVKLELSIEGKEYMIYRGIAPGFLKLYENYTAGDEDKKNNDSETQDSAKKFTQKKIDDLIGSNYNTFSHLLVMSNSYSAPFLDLKSDKKREIIENILGISVFGLMTEQAKDLSLELKGQISVTKREYDVNLINLTNLKEKVDQLKKKANEFETEKKRKIKDLTARLNKVMGDLKVKREENTDEELSELIDQLNVFLDKKKTKKQDLLLKAQVNKEKQTSKKEIIDQLNDTPVCPICNTKTDSDHVESHMSSLQDEVDKAKKQIDICMSEVDKINEQIKQINQKIKDTQNEIKKQNSLKTDIAVLEQEETTLKNQAQDVLKEKNTFTDLIDEDELIEKERDLNVLKVSLNESSKEREHYEYIRKLLSDKGVKNFIIKKVITFWNKKVNQYLGKLNAEFNIKFNEQMDAVIKSRNRDELQYHSFSGGEKSRIDVAILLSLIDLSKLQNSIDLNMMVVDELLDSGLDETGREDVLNLFREMATNEKKSIYLISHNSNLPTDLFDKEVVVYKKNGFTSIN